MPAEAINFCEQLINKFTNDIKGKGLAYNWIVVVFPVSMHMSQIWKKSDKSSNPVKLKRFLGRLYGCIGCTADV